MPPRTRAPCEAVLRSQRKLFVTAHGEMVSKSEGGTGDGGETGQGAVNPKGWPHPQATRLSSPPPGRLSKSHSVSGVEHLMLPQMKTFCFPPLKSPACGLKV